jgi:hypothetical protein
VTPLSRAAGQLDEAAAHLAGPADLDPGAASFGAGVPGRFGALGREAHARLAAELADHARVAASLRDRLAGTAATLRTAGGGYADAEGSSARRSTQAGES